jgi:ubiquinone biosynthesis protein
MHASLIEARLHDLSPEQLCTALAAMSPAKATAEERIRAIEAALRSPEGQALRGAMARWIVEKLVPVEALVPPAYVKWRPPVRDAMMFVVTHLSAGRLAPKLLEQIELPPNTSPETRLLRLIAKVPGLQKLGQVIARNRHLGPSLRNALAKLENGIRDVNAEEICAIIRQQLGGRIREFDVRLQPDILSEASVSAVVCFTWRDPLSGKRERGVFKVLKPHIPDCFSEDMEFLHDLAQWFGIRHSEYGFPRNLIPDTFRKVRRVLQHEVDFVREQKTLVEARALYGSIAGVRVPRLIPQLCSPTITAMTEEAGAKVTNVAARMPARRRKHIAEQLLEALVAVPLFAAEKEAVFHGDPHAGNLLYDSRSGELVIIDWALRERLSREQRRHLALLFLVVSLRDPVGAANEIQALTQSPVRRNSRQALLIRETVSGLLDELPLKRLPSGADVMRLLERVAMGGIRFPASLIMLSKVLLTLDGILEDVAGSGNGMGLGIAGLLARHWLTNRKAFRLPLAAKDLLHLQCGAVLYGSRLWVRCEQALVDRLLPPQSGAPELSTKKTKVYSRERASARRSAMTV